VAHKVLFGSDVESFEYELKHAVTAEAVELATWRRKGPIGKLHNIIRYILHLSERQDAFLALQTTALELSEEVENNPRVPLRLIRDNVTRWNSWYDAAVRAIEHRDAIDEFTDGELVDYKQRLTRHERRSQAAQKDPPKAPSILHDKLYPDDWHVITIYVAILKPCKQATMKLQGNVSTTSKRGRAVKGAIWQVLPIYVDLLKGFEDARERHLPASADSQATPATSAPPPLQPSTRHVSTRRGKRTTVGRASATAIDAEGGMTPAATQVDEDSTLADNFAESQIGTEFFSLEHHLTHNINAAWQKLEYYYNLTDNTPTYRAAVFLHPKLKWR
jgi:hypothetical protein